MWYEIIDDSGVLYSSESYDELLLIFGGIDCENLCSTYGRDITKDFAFKCWIDFLYNEAKKGKQK